MDNLKDLANSENINKAVVLYETQHVSAQKVASIVAEKINAKCINIDTPFEAENLDKVSNVVLVFNFRGPYTAQLTKLYMQRVKEQLKDKNVYLIGEGLFSEKEFPIVANEINKMCPSKTFNTYFVKGQLRMSTLTPEENALLSTFSKITGMRITDLGNLDTKMAEDVAEQISQNMSIEETLNDEKQNIDNIYEEERETTTETITETEEKWICPMCGYVHVGKTPPDVCPMCGVPGSMFKKA